MESGWASAMSCVDSNAWGGGKAGGERNRVKVRGASGVEAERHRCSVGVRNARACEEDEAGAGGSLRLLQMDVIDTGREFVEEILVVNRSAVVRSGPWHSECVMSVMSSHRVQWQCHQG